MNCGQPLRAATETDASLQARLIAAAPAPLVEKMRAAKLTGERKPVTALFADVVGSTTLAEQMDPEDWTQIINEAFDLMSTAVFRYEGTIAQLQGDAMLAFFGAPVAHEDDPDRAIRAAIDMVREVDEFARQLKQERGIEFRIRAGVNTGPVIVGNVGSDLRYEYTALGDAVNVAARVQTSAKPGEVLITAATKRLVGDAFEFEDLGDAELRGKSEVVQIYRAIGVRAPRGQTRGLHSVGLSSRLVGRTADLEALEQAWAVARAGRGRVAVVIGEPGIGKSRLLAELRMRTAEQGAEPGGARWVEGRCVSYGRSVPYHLIIDLVRSIYDIPFAASESAARTMLDERAHALLGDEASEVVAFLAHMLLLPLSEQELELVRLEPEVLQSRYVAAIHRSLRALTASDALVLVFEDIHWADPASVEVTLQILPLAASLPVLTIFAGRSETDAPGWRLVTQMQAALGPGLTEIRLQPLNEVESRELVANLLEIESLPDSVRDTILTSPGARRRCSRRRATRRR
jgi:class 3 adenylate cyclase